MARANERGWGDLLRFFKKKYWEEKMNSEICPVGTELLLKRLGYVLDAARTRWMPVSSDSTLPAGSTGPDRLDRVAAARMSEISPERAFIEALAGPQGD